MKYVCDACGWIYDEEEGYPEGGIAPGTAWEDVPEDFECPSKPNNKKPIAGSAFFMLLYFFAATSSRATSAMCAAVRP